MVGWILGRMEKRGEKMGEKMFFEVYGLDFKEGKLVGLSCFLLRPTKILSSQFREKIERRRVVVVK